MTTRINTILTILSCFLLFGCHSNSKAQEPEPDQVVYQTSKGRLYGPKFKYGNQKLIQEFLVSFSNERYDLIEFDWGDRSDSLIAGRIRVALSLDISATGELTEIFVIDDHRNAVSLRPALDRIQERLRDAWIPAYAIYNDNPEPQKGAWDFRINLYFKEGRLDKVIMPVADYKEEEPEYK